VITDEQVEAAAIAVWRLTGVPASDIKWDDVNDRARYECRTIARAVLEAANAATWKKISEAHPRVDARYLVKRAGFIHTATPCYGMRAPRWIPMSINGEDDEYETIKMLDDDEWHRLLPSSEQS